MRIRVAGQTDWKKLWMVISASSSSSVSMSDRPGSSHSQHPSQSHLQNTPKKNRVSQLFSRSNTSDTQAFQGSAESGPLPPRPTIAMYTSPRLKERKTKGGAPVLTLSSVSQAFAVYPERPELIARSTLVKVEGLFGNGESEEAAGGMKGREGWVLVMPELDVGQASAGGSSEMLKWVVGESSFLVCFWDGRLMFFF